MPDHTLSGARWFVPGFVLGAFLASGCEAVPSNPDVVVRDSLGITIVENIASEWDDTEGWAVQPSPSMTIGGGEGHEFFRIAEIFALDDGRIAVLDGGDSELLFFAGDGEHLLTAGGPGEGPGEFQGTLSAALAGDSIVIFDAGLYRLSAFGLEGEFLDARRVSSNLEFHAPLGFYRLAGAIPARGYVLAKAGSMGNTGLPEPTVWWDSSATVIVGFDGEAEEAVGEPAGMDMYGAPGRSGFPRWGRSTQKAMQGGSLYMGQERAYEIVVYGPDGALEKIVRKTHEPLSADHGDELLIAWGEEIVQEQGLPMDTLDHFRAQVAEQPRRETLPAHGGILVDQLGFLWVERYRPEWNGRLLTDDEPAWDVFDPEGRWLGAVVLPERFEPMAIGEDFVLGVWTDELEVQQVHRYPLSRAGPT